MGTVASDVAWLNDDEILVALLHGEVDEVGSRRALGLEP